MTSLRLAPSLIACAAAVCGADPAAAPPDKGPSLRLAVTIDGKPYECTANGTFTATIDGKEIKVTLAELPTKRFHADGISFDFPSQHAYKVEHEDTGTTWTLDGEDNVLTVIKTATKEDDYLDQVVGQMVDTYKKKNVTITEVAMPFGKITAKGKRLLVKIAGTQLAQEIYCIDTADGKIVVIIQDSLDDEGNETGETKEAKRLLTTTFKLDEQPAAADPGAAAP